MFDEMTQDQNTSRAQAEIDENLRRAYNEVTQQDVPERFKQLLDRLKESDQAANSNAASDATPSEEKSAE